MIQIEEKEQIYLCSHAFSFMFNCNDLILANQDKTVFTTLENEIKKNYYDRTFMVSYGWFYDCVPEIREFTYSGTYHETSSKYTIKCVFSPIDKNSVMKVKIYESFTKI